MLQRKRFQFSQIHRNPSFPVQLKGFLISVNISQLLFPSTDQEIANQTFWWLLWVVSPGCCISSACPGWKVSSTKCSLKSEVLNAPGTGAGPFPALQITVVNWSLISMQQAWENDKLLLTLSWQLKKWLLWKNKVHNRRKAKASFLSSVWHLLFNIRNCIIVPHTSTGREGLGSDCYHYQLLFAGLISEISLWAATVRRDFSPGQNLLYRFQLACGSAGKKKRSCP